MEAAAQMTGSQFVFYKSPAVNLIYALTRMMLKNNKKCGFEPVLPPYLVNEKSLENASNFPKFKDQVYKINDEDLYLTPTSEVNLTNYYRDHIFNSSDLPIRMTSWTSCFRREAGSYGAQERGLIRIHQFEKVELYTICKPEDADSEQLKMLDAAENILNKLGLHYRISLLAAQDCSFASTKTFDLEVWMPGQNAYYEVSSCSNCTDFQARRTGIRYKDDKKNHLVNTLNCSSLALPRLIVALMETYQQEDGSIKLPTAVLEEALW
jgi:seryl-tRNA synthetase